MFSSLFSSSPDAPIDEFLSLINKAIAPYFAIESQPSWLEQKKSTLYIRPPLPIASLLSENRAIQELAKAHKLTLRFNNNIPSTKGLNPDKFKNLIAVSSGKGGVGKSTVALNLALALKKLGAKVGILDADIYGPSLPVLLDTQDQKPDSPDGKLMYPIESLGLQSMSIGNLVSDKDAAVWRGPMASKALQQLFNETLWDKLDYLIVDMPPGTGDIQITMAQQLPVAGSIVVTTPQQLALADAIKGIAMFNKVNVPVFGVVENMSYYLCGSCDTKHYLFGEGGGKQIAQQQQTPLLGELPLISELNQQQALDIFQDEQYQQLQQQYLNIALAMSYQLCQQPLADQQIPVVSV